MALPFSISDLVTQLSENDYQKKDIFNSRLSSSVKGENRIYSLK